jgi:AraC-like DNA-binding protein
MSDAYVAMPLIAANISAAHELGLDRPRLLRATGLDEEALADPDRLVPESVEKALWAEMVEQAGDTSIGILVGERFPRGSLRVLDYLVRTSPNLGMGLRLIPRYNRLLRSYSANLVREDAAGLRFESQRDYDIRSPPEIAGIESVAMNLLHSCRDAIGVNFVPAEVSFRHERSSAEEVYARLGPNVQFDRPRAGMLFDRESLLVPMLEADPVLHDILQRCATKQLDTMPHSAPATKRVYEALVRLVPQRDPTLDAAARELETSPRALQRELQTEGTTFRAVVERVREQFAKRYLAEANLSTVEVALLLDYSDAPSFHRAFKRWTGISPGAYRKSLTE